MKYSKVSTHNKHKLRNYDISKYVYLYIRIIIYLFKCTDKHGKIRKDKKRVRKERKREIWENNRIRRKEYKGDRWENSRIRGTREHINS